MIVRCCRNALCVLLCLAAVSLPATAQENPVAATPVLAQRVAELPAGNLHWSASRIEVDAGSNVSAPIALAGFVLVDAGEILVVGPGMMPPQLLSTGQAGTTSGPGDRLLAAGDEPATGWHLVLQGSNGEGEERLGEAFASPRDARDVELRQMLLQPGDTDWTGTSDFPALIVASSSNIQVVTPDATVAVARGEAAILPPGAVIQVTGDAAVEVFVVAIGGQTPLPMTGQATVTVRAFTCPPAVGVEDLPHESCQAATEGFAMLLHDPKAGFTDLTLAEAVPLEDGYRWPELPLADGDASYEVSVTSPPPSYGQAWLIGAGEPEAAQTTVTVSAIKPEATVSVYFLAASAPPANSVTLLAFPCPEASTPDESCLANEAIALPGVTLRHEDDAQTLAGNNAEPTGEGGLLWIEVPAGTWWLYPADIVPPEGYVVRNITGSLETTEDGWRVIVSKDGEPVRIEILLAPVDSEPASG